MIGKRRVVDGSECTRLTFFLLFHLELCALSTLGLPRQDLEANKTGRAACLDPFNTPTEYVQYLLFLPPPLPPT